MWSTVPHICTAENYVLWFCYVQTSDWYYCWDTIFIFRSVFTLFSSCQAHVQKITVGVFLICFSTDYCPTGLSPCIIDIWLQPMFRWYSTIPTCFYAYLLHNSDKKVLISLSCKKLLSFWTQELLGQLDFCGGIQLLDWLYSFIWLGFSSPFILKHAHRGHLKCFFI